jgi:hypothetical protein
LHVEVRVSEAAGSQCTGIVDEKADARVLAQPRLHAGEVFRHGQIAAHDFDGDAGLASQAPGDCLQAILVPRDQDEVKPTVGETVRIGRTDARRSPRYECCLDEWISHITTP